MKYQIVIQEDIRANGDALYRAYIDIIVGKTFFGTLKKERWCINTYGWMSPPPYTAYKCMVFDSFEEAKSMAKVALDRFIIQKERDTTILLKETIVKL